jgi:prophage DNA circulation protein
MRPASFRGVSFGVSGDDKESGRRTVLHEFPQREEVYVEDLGAVATRFTVQAFVLGSDYMERRDALERALSEPGPGTLAHPWYGEITVSQFAPYKVKHSAQDGGMAVFTLSFALYSRPSSPAAVVNAHISALDKAGRAGLLACSAFDAAFKIAGETFYVVEQAYNSVLSVFTRVQAALGGDVSQMIGLLGAASGYDFFPLLSVGRKLWSGFQALGTAAGKNEAGLAADWQAVASLNAPTPTPANPGSTRARVAANAAAVYSFTRRIAMVESARAMTLATPESRAQARGLREGFTDALDLVLADGYEEGEEKENDLYASFTAMRASTLAALAEAARSAPDVVSYTPAAVLPSLVLCYRLSGDIRLEPDLVARNSVIHPGFVPVEPLEALTA